MNALPYALELLGGVPTDAYILASYAFFPARTMTEWRRLLKPLKPHVLVDSGAFTAYTTGSKIDLAGYIRFVRKAQDDEAFAGAFNLDVIGEGEASRDNWRAMLTEGCGVIPVFHPGEPARLLDEYAAESDYVALGGIARRGRSSEVREWVAWCFKRIERAGHPVRVHGLGVTNADFLRAFPWHTVDSSSWVMFIRGVRDIAPLYDPRTGRLVRYSVTKPPTDYERRLLRDYGLTPEGLAGVNATTVARYDRAVAITLSFLGQQLLQKEVGIPIYLADMMEDYSRLASWLHRFFGGGAWHEARAAS